MIAKLYGAAIQGAFEKKIDWVADTVTVYLTTASYVPDQDTHITKADITNIIGSGVAPTGKALTYTAGTNTVKMDCDDILFAAVTGAVRRAVFCAGSGTTAQLICYWDFEADTTLSAQDLTLVIPVTGVVTVNTA